MVLGMHRSGTSALTGLLEKLGGELSESLMPASEYNALGYFESQNLSDFNNEVLRSIGTAWDFWSPLPADWVGSPAYRDLQNQARALVSQEYAGRSLFLFKDPRLCRLSVFWHEVLDSLEVSVKVVHTHRHPANVAASLHRRDGLEKQFGLLLWLRYVLDAESGSRGKVRGFTSFERIMADWMQEIARLEAALDLSFPQRMTDATSKVAHFLSPSLVNFPPKDQGSDTNLPCMVKTVYDIIEKWIETGEDPADHGRLDEIGKRLAEDAAIYAPLIPRRSLNQQVDAARKAYQSEAERSQALLARLADSETQLRQRFHDLLHHRRALDEARAEIASFSRRVQSSVLEAERNGREIVHLKALVLRQQEDLARSAHQAERQADPTRSAHQAERQYKRERQARKKAEAQISALYSSNSWRITAPLRMIGRLIKRLRTQSRAA